MIKKQLEKILNNEESTITFTADTVVSINEDKSVTVMLPNAQAIAFKLIETALNAESETQRINAIREIIDRLEGKASQKVEVETVANVVVKTKRPGKR